MHDHNPNPWTYAMAFGWVLTGLLGLILIATGGSDSLYEDEGYTTAQLAGAGFLSLSGTLLIAWLVVGALTWRPAPPGGTGAVRGHSAVDRLFQTPPSTTHSKPE